MFLIYLLICFVSYLIAGTNASGASIIKPCKPNDNECIKASAEAAIGYLVPGIPEYGIPPSDPITIDSVRADGVNLKFGLKNVKVFGASKSKIIDLVRNTEKNTIKLTAEFPVTGKGQYDLNGKLYFIEVTGEGDVEFKTDKFQFTVEAKIQDVQKDGHRYWKLTGFDYSYEFLEKVYIKFKNLFGGDEVRAKPIHDVIDHSWKEFVYEICGPIVKKILSSYVENIDKLFDSMPADQLELA